MRRIDTNVTISDTSEDMICDKYTDCIRALHPIIIEHSIWLSSITKGIVICHTSITPLYIISTSQFINIKLAYPR